MSTTTTAAAARPGSRLATDGSTREPTREGAVHEGSARPGAEVAVFLGVVAACLTATTATGVALDVDVSRIDEAPPLGQAVMFGQALIPLLAAVVARLATGGSLRHPGWGARRTSWRSVGIAWGTGLAVSLGSASLVWLAGLAGVETSGLGLMTLLGLTALVGPYTLLALAEDVGWRGVLVERLAQRHGPVAVVLGSGLAWAAFHYPLMLVLGGAPEGVPVAVTLAVWTVGCVAFAAVLAVMQLRWGLWPGVVMHAVVNATGYHVVAPLVRETDLTAWAAGETGIVGALAMLLAAAVAWRLAPLVHEGGRTTARTSRPTAP